MASPSLPSYGSQAFISKAGRSSDGLELLADSMLRASIERDRSAAYSAVLSPSTTRNSTLLASSSTTGPSLTSTPLSNASSSITGAMCKQGQPSSSTSAVGLRSSTSHPGIHQPRASPHISIKETKPQLTELANESKAIQKIASQSSKFTFPEACSTDLLFLIDCTYSMESCVKHIRRIVKKIVDDISKAFFRETEILIAIVVYRDHGLDVNVEALDFTSDIYQVISFLDKLETKAGYGSPKDVLGGIDQALDMTWSQATRCIIHIGDAPPHGRDLQDPIDIDDCYPTPGKEPHELTYKPLIKMMIKMDINYVLLPINDSMDKMAFQFAAIYVEKGAGARFHSNHRYYQALQNLKRTQSIESLTTEGQVVCVVAKVGAVPGHLKDLVVKNVLDSASRTAIRTSAEHISRDLSESSALSTINRESFNTIVPSRNHTAHFPIITDLVGYAPKLINQDNKSLYKMMRRDDNIHIGRVNLRIHRQPEPFSRGSCRLAYHARTPHSSIPYVIKTFETDGKEMPYLIEDIRIQSLCKAFALEFNAATGESETDLDFLLTSTLKPRDGAPTVYSIERYISGLYTKYNNNAGFVLESSDPSTSRFNALAQAFSHFTFEISRGEFLVCNLKGVDNILTNPAIHTRDPKRFLLTETNLNVEGFIFFFATHECNHICTKLQLQSNKDTIVNGASAFREIWPHVVETVCCSNKFCRKIVRAQSIRKSATHPDFFWCEECGPQIGRSMVVLTCDGGSGSGSGSGANGASAGVAAGSAGGVFARHAFEESAFFWESQGCPLLTRCMQHRAVKKQVEPRVIE